MESEQVNGSNDVITLYLLREIFKSFHFTLRLVGFFPTSCSPRDLLPDSTFTKHELLFVLSVYSKHCHTSLSRLRQTNNRDTFIFIRQIYQLGSNRQYVAEGRRMLSYDNIQRSD